MNIEEMEGKFIRYTSDATMKEGTGCWYGKVDSVSGDEIEINGCLHTKSSINVLEVLIIG